MKARLAFLSIALCLCLLAGWGVSGVEKPLQEDGNGCRGQLQLP